MRLSRYSLVTYINTCSCGVIQTFSELHALYITNHRQHWALVKPGATVYQVGGPITTEFRKMSTRACFSCIETLERQPWIEDPTLVVGTRARKPETISLKDIEYLL